MKSRSAPEQGASFPANDADVATRSVRVSSKLLERARRIAARMPVVPDARGHMRMPTPAEAVRTAATRGLQALEAELLGASS